MEPPRLDLDGDPESLPSRQHIDLAEACPDVPVSHPVAL